MDCEHVLGDCYALLISSPETIIRVRKKLTINWINLLSGQLKGLLGASCGSKVADLGGMIYCGEGIAWTFSHIGLRS